MPLGSVVVAGVVVLVVVEGSSRSMTEVASTLVELGGEGAGRLRALR